jgi:NAD(P)-dependent dehydrogenase (short-subunit alcohol dehydrogenase family)
LFASNTDRFQPHITPVHDRLRDKTAVVTGAGHGIGRAIALRFAQEGAQIVVADKDWAAAESVAAEVREHGVGAAPLRVDVTRRQDVEAMVQATVDEFGEMHILVNNAGVIVFGSLMECRPEDWDSMLAVDLTGAFYCTQAAGRQMKKQGKGGRMIHIGSTASLLPAPYQAAYSVAKAGLLMMSRMAAMELAGDGITSNTICPQGAVTNLNRDLLADETVMANLEAKIPAGRMAKVEEIAAAVAFLASDESVYITGTELVHDGGSLISALWWR